MAHKHMMNKPKSARAGMPHYDEAGNPKPPRKPRAAKKPRKSAKKRAAPRARKRGGKK